MMYPAARKVQRAMIDPSPDPNAAWYKDDSGKTRNDELQLWLGFRSYRDSRMGRLLRLSDDLAGQDVASFKYGISGRELSEVEKRANPGIDYELVFEVNARPDIILPGYGVDLRETIEAALRAHEGSPALYQMREEGNLYALVSVVFDRDLSKYAL
jgi:hypothetical protein